MGGQLSGEVVAVDVQDVALPAHAAVAPLVPARDAEPAPLEAHESVEADLAPRAQVEGDLAVEDGGFASRQAPVAVGIRRNQVEGPPVFRRLGRAPCQRLGVELRDVLERPACEEVALDELHEPLHLALREGVARLAQPGLEAHALHERGVVGLPYGPSLGIAARDDALHVVGEHVVGDAHHHEGVDHADEQALLPGVGEELDVEGAAVVADHREAGDLVLVSQPVHDVGEAPVHLVGLARLGLEAVPPASLRGGQPSLGGDQRLVRPDVVLHGGDAARVPVLAQPVEAHRGVRDTAPQQLVEPVGVAVEDGARGLGAGAPMGQRLEPVGLDGPGPGPREAGAAGELRQVEGLEVERAAVFGAHLLERLVYNLLQAIAFLYIHIPPNTGVLAYPV